MPYITFWYRINQPIAHVAWQQAVTDMFVTVQSSIYPLFGLYFDGGDLK